MCTKGWWSPGYEDWVRTKYSGFTVALWSHGSLGSDNYHADGPSNSQCGIHWAEVGGKLYFGAGETRSGQLEIGGPGGGKWLRRCCSWLLHWWISILRRQGWATITRKALRIRQPGAPSQPRAIVSASSKTFFQVRQVTCNQATWMSLIAVTECNVFVSNVGWLHSPVTNCCTQG